MNKSTCAVVSYPGRAVVGVASNPAVREGGLQTVRVAFMGLMRCSFFFFLCLPVDGAPDIRTLFEIFLLHFLVRTTFRRLLKCLTISAV